MGNTRRHRRSLVIAGIAILLTGCARQPASVATVAPTIAPALAPPATASPIPVPTATATPLPAPRALDWLTQTIARASADADRQNGALTARLNAGTSIPPILTMLQQATTANQKAAAAISALALPPTLPYRAAYQYQAAMAAVYSTQADAWDALARAAAPNDAAGQQTYQVLMQQTASRRQDASVAHDRVLVALGLAPEGSASD